MRSLWFVVPVHGRLPLAAICLRQLARTCDALIEHDIDASAVVIADRRNLRHLDELEPGIAGQPDLGRSGRFAAVERDNTFLSRKFNDGIQLACDPNLNPRPADYVVPCGSDDWVDWRVFASLPHPRSLTVFGFQRISFVREDGREMVARDLRYEGGSGIRVFQRQVMERVGWRPADEDRSRACDTSILTNLRRAIGDELRVLHRDIDPRQIVDWKTPAQQLNPYDSLRQHRGVVLGDPFVELDGVFPDVALDEMRRHYLRTSEPVPA